MQTVLGRPLPGSRVHFVGIGGVGMAALAELLLALGYEVSGSDLKESRVTQRLGGLGARIGVPHRAELVQDADHVVVSNAIPADNPEVRRASDLGTDTISRAKLLGRIFDAGRGVGVSGTHGKTTTSSMLARVLDAAGFDPSFVIGGDLNDVGSGAHLGSTDLVVAEADEAYGSFLELRSSLAVVTNVDVDHLDHYGTPDAIDEAFIRFLSQRTPDGAAVVCADDAGVRRLRSQIAEPVVTYGADPEADLVLTGEDGAVRFAWRGTDLGVVRLRVPGHHMILNAAGAAAAALVLGAEGRGVVETLVGFGGVERRFSVRGEVRGVVVVDDYAHHPREIAASLNAARHAYPGRRIVVLFQPHLYSRTLDLAADFGLAFEDADVVVVTDVYGARELPMPGVSGRLVSDAVRARSVRRVNATYVPRLEEASGFVVGQAEPGDVVLTMGAGDVTTAAPRILELLRDSDVASPSR